MTVNVGGADRIFRIVGGIVVIAAGIYLKSWWGIIGVPLLLTGVIRWCPAYLPFGISSNRQKTT